MATAQGLSPPAKPAQQPGARHRIDDYWRGDTPLAGVRMTGLPAERNLNRRWGPSADGCVLLCPYVGISPAIDYQRWASGRTWRWWDQRSTPVVW